MESISHGAHGHRLKEDLRKHLGDSSSSTLNPHISDLLSLIQSRKEIVGFGGFINVEAVTVQKLKKNTTHTHFVFRKVCYDEEMSIKFICIAITVAHTVTIITNITSS